MMPKFVVTVGPVDHDGAIYEEGSELSLPEDTAAALVAVGVIQEVERPGKGRKPAVEETPAEDVH